MKKFPSGMRNRSYMKCWNVEKGTLEREIHLEEEAIALTF